VSAVPPLDIPGLENPEVIGEGGFGTVYKVDEPEFGRSVAVKIIQERLDEDSVKRAFIRECQAMGKLSGHPHIVTVLRGGTTDAGRPYIVMDLMSGGSLGDRIARDGPMQWPEVLEVGVLMAGALETAHRAGILHLDLKPANVLVSKYGEPKLADFGISRLPGVAETTEGRVKASVAFAAPERLLDGTASAAADLYGLGATMFTLLTGHPAFSGGGTSDLLAMVARVVRDPVPDLRLRGVPDPAARVVERLMAKSPAERYPSAADAAVALQAAQRSAGRSVTRAVIEGERPSRGDTATWAGPRSGDGVAPLRPLVPGYSAAAAGPGVSGPSPQAPAWISQPYPNRTPGAQRSAPHGPAQQKPAQRPPQIPTQGPPPGPPTRPVVGGPMPPPPGWAPPPPAPRGNTGLIVAAVVATVVIVVITVITIYVATRPQGGNEIDSGSGGGLTRTTTAAAPSTTTPPRTTTPATTTPFIPYDDTVAVVDGVDHPSTSNVRTTLSEYIRGINESRYEDAFALFTTDSGAYQGGIDVWIQGQDTTVIYDAVIYGVRDIGQDTLAVDVRFTSWQSVEDGPDGQLCSQWDLTYEMVGPDPRWLIRKATSNAAPVGC
jgi:serine/threonine protein kinase